MVQASLSDLRNVGGEFWMRGWRCIQCGEILDATILANRQVRHKPEVNRSRQNLGPIAFR